MFELTKDAIKVTESAVNHLKNCMSLDDKAIGIRLRIVDGRGCGGSEYDMDFIKEESKNDDILELSRDLKLYIPKKDVLKLFGTIIDYKTDKLGNSRIHIQNPNETGQCGCGMSVSFEDE